MLTLRKFSLDHR